MLVKFGNSVKDVPILEVTAANYIVPQGEEGSYHCRIEQTQFNPRNGKRLSVPRIQKFSAKMWPILSHNLKLQGWDIDILHDPTDWLRKQEEEARMTENERIKARKEAEARRKAEEYAKMKAEILADLKKEGYVKVDEAKTQQEPKTGGSKKK